MFDEIWARIPAPYRQVDPTNVVDVSKKSKKKKSKDAGLSLADLNERAVAKIEENRRVNAEKSQKKIAELTKMHKEQGLGIHKKADLAQEESQSSGEDEEMKEESKSKGKTKTEKTKEPKVYENKNTVAKSKLKNKRAVKEALKKNKQKRQKGTTKEAADEGSDKEMSAASGSDDE